jgi:hypothetical protein
MLILAFLGHDLLMAAESHAAPAHESRVSFVASTHLVSADERAMLRSNASEAGHPAGCGVVRPASSPIGDTSDRGAQTTAGVGGIHAVALLLDEAWRAAHEQPCWPLGKQRALLQIYRM